jgi:formylglycine-generating enzyme required for sulfatase activity
MQDERESLRRLIEEAQARLAALEGGTGGLEAEHIQARDIVTGVQVNHIVHVYRAGGGGWSEEDYRAALTRYLDWLRAATGKVTLRGIIKRKDLPGGIELSLDEVYVPLAAEALPEAREGLKRGLDEGLGESGQAWRITMRELLAQGSRLALIGAPGCGKTTVLYHIAWTLAEALRTGQTRLVADRLGLSGELPLPVYIPLSLYADHRRRFADHPDPRQRQLATFINHNLIERQAGLALPDDFFATLLNQGRHVILLLDGLDEVPSEEERAVVSQTVRDLTYGREHAHFVVSSRTRAYQGEAVLGGDFRVVRVLPLVPEQVTDLIQRAYYAIYSAQGEKDERARRTTDLVTSVGRLEAERAARMGGGEETRLVITPLMVRMLLIVHFNRRRLPEQRAELYMEVVDTLLTSAHNPDERVAQHLARLGGDERTRRDMFQVLAFQMHSRGQEAGREIGEREMADWLCAYLTERRRRPPEVAEELVADFIAVSRQHGGLLDERDSRYRFTHLSFQEFLTARYLAEVERDVTSITQFLEDEGRAADAWWREPILLTVGYLKVTAPDTAIELVHCLAHLDDSQPLHTSLAMAAAELAATAFLEWGGAEATRDSLARCLADLLADPELCGASPPLRAGAGRALAYLGDPRPGVGVIRQLPPRRRGSLPDIAWCEVPAGPFLLGANADEEAREDERPQHELALPAFYIARYPVTNVQFALFIDAGGYDDPRWWAEDGWAWHDEEHRCQPGYWHNKRFNQPNQPVVGVSWYEAMAYCAWITEQLQVALKEDLWASYELHVWHGEEFASVNLELDALRVRLPTEAEWEKAAGWDPLALRKRVYTWGDEWDEEKANVANVGRPSAAGIFPAGTSACGALDMIGNVWEWTLSFPRRYPYQPGDGRESLMGGVRRTLRGGSWLSNYWYARVSYRDYSRPPFIFNDNVGFRVVIAPVLGS